MNKLNEITVKCGFTTKYEVVKLLFLIQTKIQEYEMHYRNVLDVQSVY